jgi:hypothetical protein
MIVQRYILLYELREQPHAFASVKGTNLRDTSVRVTDDMETPIPERQKKEGKTGWVVSRC